MLGDRLQYIPLVVGAFGLLLSLFDAAMRLLGRQDPQLPDSGSMVFPVFIFGLVLLLGQELVNLSDREAVYEEIQVIIEDRLGRAQREEEANSSSRGSGTATALETLCELLRSWNSMGKRA